MSVQLAPIVSHASELFEEMMQQVVCEKGLDSISKQGSLTAWIFINCKERYAPDDVDYKFNDFIPKRKVYGCEIDELRQIFERHKFTINCKTSSFKLAPLYGVNNTQAIVWAVSLSSCQQHVVVKADGAFSRVFHKYERVMHPSLSHPLIKQINVAEQAHLNRQIDPNVLQSLFDEFIHSTEYLEFDARVNANEGCFRERITQLAPPYVAPLVEKIEKMWPGIQPGFKFGFPKASWKIDYAWIESAKWEPVELTIECHFSPRTSY